jgi:glycosyltransferase involved in cell wall biosynthesis
MTSPLRRVLLVDHAGVLGGAELSLLDTLGAFGAGSAAVLFEEGPFADALRLAGVPVEIQRLGASARVRKASPLPSPAAVVDTVRAARKLARRAAPFEVIYANSQKAFVVAAIAGGLAGRPVVWHLRDMLGPPHFGRTNVRVATWLANHGARVVIANSRATAGAFVAAGGRAALAHVVYNGIDPAPFDAVTDERVAATRRAIGQSDGVPLVVHVGRFHPWKGQQVLLRALTIERRAHAWFVGAPLFGEESFAAQLDALARELGVAARVRMLGFRRDVPTLLRAADVVVHSSTLPEPFGRVIVEGMLAGRPVVATRGGGVEELVADGETALLVPPDDPRALAAALTRLLDDSPLARRLAQHGNAQARAAFSRDAMVRGVAALVAGA